jgi:ABC-type branched-chain amino acid transport systems, periplasmic component
MMIQRHALKIAVAVLLTASIPLGCVGCKEDAKTGTNGASSGNSGNTIRVGEYGSMTGSEAAFGESTHNGVSLAVDEINKNGGIDGKQVEIVGPEDTASDNQKAEIAVKSLVDKNVIAVIGEVASSRSRAGAAICQQKQIPMISPSSTNPTVTEVGDYIFRVCFIDPFQGGVMAKFAKDSLKATTAAVFYDASQTYSTGIRDEFTKAFQAKGGKVVEGVAYQAGDKDFKAQLTKLKSLNPDVIVVPGYYTEGGTIAKQARDLGITKPLIGGDGWSNAKFLQYSGDNVTDVYFSDHASMESSAPEIQNYVKAFKAKFSDKEPDSLSALGYDAMMVLADAIKRAKGTGEPALRDAIAATKDFKGVTGNITINAQRNADKGAVIIEVVNGKFKFKEAIDKP